MQVTVDENVSSLAIKKRYLRNIGSGWFAVLFNALFGVFILPINLHYLGKEVYGISVLASSILFLLHYLNFGMGPTLVRFFSQAVADSDDEKFRRISSTAQLFTGGVGLLGSIIFLCCFRWFCDNYDIDSELRTSTFCLFCGMAFTFWERFYTVTFNTILQSYQRYDILNYIRSAFVVLRVVLLVFFYKFVSPSLASLAVVICLTATLRLTILFLLAYKYGGAKTFFSFRSIDIDLAPKLFAFGALVFLNNISMGLSIQMPSLIIGSQLNKIAVADFSPALMVTSFLGSILGAIATPLTPLACLEAKKGSRRLGVWAILTGQVVACAGCWAVLVLWLFGSDWITVWLGADFAWTRPIVTIVATGAVLASIEHTNFAIALGASTIAPVAWSSLVMAISITTGSWVGLHFHLFESISWFHLEGHPAHGAGLLGIAWVIFFVRIARNVVFLSNVYSKKFDYSYLTYLYKVYFIPLVAMCSVVCFWTLTIGRFDFTSLQGYLQCRFQNWGMAEFNFRLALICVAVLKSVIASVFFAVVCWFGILPSNLKRSLYSVLRSN